jgi:serine/threonine protein phosphatase 1
MARIFAIGDLHGCADELKVLLDHVRPQAADTIVFLGDYVDRGPDSKAVVSRLLQLAREGPRCVFLKGNHEDMFLDFLGLGGHHGDAFLYNGGNATLRSYGLDPHFPPLLPDRLPPDHLAFYRALAASHREGDFLFVHAGIRPEVPLDRQDEEDLFWIREDFLHHPHGFGCIVVFGHTPQREVLVDWPFKVGLDTGLVYGNKLTCLEIGEQRLYQVFKGDHRVAERDLLLRPL